MLERRSVSEVLWARKLLADPRGAPKTGHRWTPERVFRTFGGGSAESAVLVIESGLMSAPPGCNHERHKSATPTTRPDGSFLSADGTLGHAPYNIIEVASAATIAD